MIDECQSLLDTCPRVFPAVSYLVLLPGQQARSEIAMSQEQAFAGIPDVIPQVIAPPPKQKKNPIGLLMTIARKSRRWRGGDAYGTQSIAMLARFVTQKVGVGGTAVQAATEINADPKSLRCWASPPHAKRIDCHGRRNFRENQSAMLATLTAGTTTKR